MGRQRLRNKDMFCREGGFSVARMEEAEGGYIWLEVGVELVVRKLNSRGEKQVSRSPVTRTPQ